MSATNKLLQIVPWDLSFVKKKTFGIFQSTGSDSFEDILKTLPKGANRSDFVGPRVRIQKGPGRWLRLFIPLFFFFPPPPPPPLLLLLLIIIIIIIIFLS